MSYRNWFEVGTQGTAPGTVDNRFRDPNGLSNMARSRVEDSRKIVSATSLSGKVKELLGKQLSEAASGALRGAQWADANSGARHPVSYVGSNVGTAVGQALAKHQEASRQAYIDGMSGLMQTKFNAGPAQNNQPQSNTFDQVAAGLAPAYQQGIARDLGAISNSMPGFEVQQQKKAQEEEEKKTAAGLFLALQQLMGQ